MNIQDYINIRYAGNKTAFAKSQGVSRKTVHNWCDDNYYIHAGIIYRPIRFLKLNKEK